MEASKELNSYTAGILVVSDTVNAGLKEDSSGLAVVKILNSGKHFTVTSIQQDCVADDTFAIQNILKVWADSKEIDLILTVGGTGFSARDVTPEATKAVIDREAPHLASHMILGCTIHSKFSVLSRSTCGMRGKSLILNLPGSAKAAVECFEMVASILPHAMDQLKSNTQKVSDLHSKIQNVD